jgi:hypothetical protein
MKRSRVFIGGLLAVVLAAGCGSDDGSAPNGDLTLEGLVGTWNATLFKYTSRTNPNLSVDAIAAGGVASMSVGSEGDYSVVVVIPGDPVNVIKGSLVVTDGTIVVHDAREDETLTFQATITGLALAMLTNHATFDFVGAGNEELATLEIVWEPASGTSMADLEGTWEGAELLFISQPDEADTVDVISDGGSLTLIIDDDGSYGLAMTLPEDLPALENGTVFIDEARLILIGDSPLSDVMVFNFELAADTLFLDGNSEYDFDDDGTDEPALIEAELQRQSA